MTSLGFLVLSAAMPVAPQDVVRGVVRDSVDLEPVAYARVAVEAPPGSDAVRATETDRFGTFAVVVAGAGGPVRVVVEAPGYRVWEEEYPEVPGGDLRALVVRAPIALEGVTVSSEVGADPLSASPGVYRVGRELILSQPVVLETDVLRVTAVSPSASASSDWVAVPFIRGGTAEGTPVTLDGTRLFNPFHAGGFVSAVNAEAVGSVSLLTGASFDALSTGSLSGAIDIATRDGARDRFRASGSVGLVTARATVEGPIGASTSYLVDGRRTYVDLATRALRSAGMVDFDVPYGFGDIHAKVTRDFGDTRRLSATGYWNTELFDTRPETPPEDVVDALRDAHRVDWDSRATAIHYRHGLGGGAVVDANAGFSAFGGAYVIFDGKTADADTAAVVDAGMREYHASLRVRLPVSDGVAEGGVEVKWFEADHEGANQDDRDWLPRPFDLSSGVVGIAAHAGARKPVARQLSVGAGIRADVFPGVAAGASPYAELSYEEGNTRSWVSGVRSHQVLASLRNEEPGLASYFAFDLLAPVPDGPLPRSTGVSAGWEGRFPSGPTVRVEGFARWLDNLLLPELSPNPFESQFLEPLEGRMEATGTARGVEVSASWSGGWGNAQGSYRWSRTWRTVGGRTYVPRFHREHEGELSGGLRRGRSLWSLRFSARSGQPGTPVTAFLPFSAHRTPGGSLIVIRDDVLHLAGDYNSVRLPAYVRMDLGWRGEWEVEWFGGGTMSPYASLANLFSMPNVVGVAPAYSLSESEYQYGPQLPMLPFFGVEFRF